MIKKISGKFYLACDLCDKEVNQAFETFDDAIIKSYQLGWLSDLTITGWEILCLTCIENYATE